MKDFLKILIGLAWVLTCACAQPSGTSDDAGNHDAPAPVNPGDGDWWRPTPGTSWQIQLSGSVDTSFDVQAYDIDLFESDAGLIADLHAQGRKVICYFSAGSIEDWRPDAGQFPAHVIGKDYDGWPGEKWLDIRRIDALAPIMRARMDMAVQKKCDAVDPDNVEAYQIDSGFPLTGDDQLAFNKWLAAEAHGRGLAIGLKNDLGQIGELVAHFDFAINEECFENDECEDLTPFIEANKPVFGIEYKGTASSFCPLANQMNFDTLKKELELGAKREACR